MLLLVPWSIAWEQNLFVEISPLWGSVARLDGVRGAVTGVGLVSLCIGVWELTVIIGAGIRRRRGSEAARLSPAARVERTFSEEGGS